MEIRCKLLIRLNLIKLNLINYLCQLISNFCGGIWVLHYLLLHDRQTNIYLLQISDPVASMWYPLLGQSVFS